MRDDEYPGPGTACFNSLKLTGNAKLPEGQ